MKKRIVVKMAENLSRFSKLINELKAILKLNQYEAKVFLVLAIYRKPLAAKEIAEKSTVPIQRVYDILERLKAKGFIAQTGQFPKTYVAKNLEALLKKRFIEERIRLNEWQHEEIKRISEEKQKRLNYLKKISYNVLKAVQSIQKISYAEPTNIAVQVEGWDNIQELLIQLLKEAKKSFWGVSRPLDWRDLTTLGIIQPRELSEWYEAIDVRGVDVKWLTSLNAIPSYIGFVQASYLPRRFIDDQKIPEKYVIIDGEKVIINLQDPRVETRTAVAVLIESVSVARIFEYHFQTLWNEAIPAEDVIKDVKNHVESVFLKLKKSNLTDLDIRVYMSLLRIGASSVKDIRIDLKWNDTEETPSIKLLRKTLKKLVHKGIVEKHPILDLYIPKNPKTLQTIV